MLACCTALSVALLAIPCSTVTWKFLSLPDILCLCGLVGRVDKHVDASNTTPLIDEKKIVLSIGAALSILVVYKALSLLA